MTELSLHILDVADNSVTAGAKLIQISVVCDIKKDKLTIVIEDDGKGMNTETLKKVTDPFTTSRTTRRVGLGLPLLKMAAETAGGTFNIESKENIGTKVTAEFKTSHIDRSPLGDLPLTITTLIGGMGSIDLLFTAALDEKSYIFDTRVVKEAICEDDLNDVEILSYLKSMIKENLEIIFKGVAI